MMAKSLMSSGAGDLPASVEKDVKLVSCGAGERQRASSGRLLDRSGAAAACAASAWCRALLARPLNNDAIDDFQYKVVEDVNRQARGGNGGRPPWSRDGTILAREVWTWRHCLAQMRVWQQPLGYPVFMLLQEVSRFVPCWHLKRAASQRGRH